MKPVTEFLQALTRQGIQLWPEAGKLRYAGPQPRLTAELLAQLKAQKVEILQELSEPTYAPASFGQRGLWAIHQQAPDNAAYHVSLAFRIHSPLDVALLGDTLQLLVNRHAALRTCFVWREDRLQQQIHGWQRVAFAPINAHGWSAAQITAYLHSFHERPFDLSSGPLVRAALLTHDEAHYTFVLSIHHIVVDGWSMYQLSDELFASYEALHKGAVAPLAPLRHTYADFVRWQEDHLARHEARLWAYWQQQLAGDLPVLQLPTDYPRGEQQQLHGINQAIRLSAALTDQLKQLAQQQGCTLYMLLLAAYQLLLYRYSGQSDLVVGLPMAGRSRPEFAEIVGYFVTPVVVRAQLTATLPFTALLQQVRTQVFGALDHQDYPFVRLVERLKPPRHTGYAPIYQASFVLQKSHRAQEQLQGVQLHKVLTVETVPLALFAGQDEISLDLVEAADGLQGYIQGRADLLAPATLARMAAHFAVLLTGIVADPNQPLGQIPLLTAAERRQLIVEWPGGDSASAPSSAGTAAGVRCIHQLFDEQVARRPQATAVIYDQTAGPHPVTLSYAELNARADALAGHLQTLGVGPEAIVGLCVERGPAMLVGLLGILKAGGAYLPLDPSYPQARLEYMLRDAQAAVLVTQSDLVVRFTGGTYHTLCLDSQQANASPTTPTVNQLVRPDHLAYVIYTSGSTGEPKGVMIEHQALSHHINTISSHYGITPDDRILQFATFSFDAAQEQIFSALGNGATLVLRGSELWTTATLTHQVAAHGITVADLPPIYFQQVLNDWIAERPAFLNGQLRLLLLGGEKIEPATIRLWRQLAPLATRLLNVYGPTEATITATTFDLTHYELASRRVDLPIGKALPSRQTYILDDQGQPTPVGVFGELYLGGMSLARGYLHRPALTAERFIPNPFVAATDEARLYKTGDRVRWLADGMIEFQSRRDQQVKIRGFRIELGEIEAVVRQHPAVQVVTVMVRSSMAGKAQIIAYLVAQTPTGPAAHESLTPNTLRTYLQSKLPEYMIPDIFFILDALPLKPNGKIDQDALPLPTAERARPEANLPRTASEKRLASIWSTVLQQEVCNVNANFFESGGHSILAIQLMQQIQQHFGIQLPVAALFQSPTIQALAQVLTHEKAQTLWSPLVAIRTNGHGRPFFCVHGAGGTVFNFYDVARTGEQPFYGLQARGLDGISEPYHSVEKMAATYITAIQTVQPCGPYCLGGYSFGGEVAFEMARQLQEQGETVDRLVLLDSYAPGTLPAAWYGEDEIALFLHAAQMLASDIGCEIPLVPKTLAALSHEERVETLVQALKQNERFSADHDSRYLEGMVRVCIANLQIRYRPPVSLQTPTLLLRAAQVPDSWLLSLEPSLGWQTFLTGPLTCETTAGDHVTMLRAPHVQTLTQKLRMYLQKQ